VTHVPNCIPAGAAFDDLFNCLRQRGDDGVHEAAGFIWRILAIAERVHHRSRTQISPALQAVERAKDFARKHLSTDIRLEDMATAASLSPYHFAHLFRKETGSTPMSFVRSLRISRAQELLYKGDLSIKQVARASGFSNVQHFTTAFKGATGYTPGEFCQSLTRS
jgi:AraC family transcriptional regulator